MTKACPPLLDRTIMPLSELLSLVLDGELYRVGDAFAPLDTPDTPALRAEVFSKHRPGPAVADRRTASWIHGARSSPPGRPEVCIDPSKRGALPSGFDAHQHRISADDSVQLAGVRVTTPLRTASDLLLTRPSFSQSDALEVRHLLLIADATPFQLRAVLARSRRAGAARARSRIPAVEQVRLPSEAA